MAAATAAALSAADVAPRLLLLDGTMAGPDVVAVGERGTILRSRDHGRSWEPCPAPVSATLTGVAFAPTPTPRLGWAVGHDAVIIGTSDGGRTWARQYQGENLADSFLDVFALDAQRVIAVGAYGLYVTTANAGETWTRRKINQDDYHFNRISAGLPDVLYLSGEHGTLLRSADAGTTWAPIEAPYEGSFYGLVSINRGRLLAHGLRGRVYLSGDEGKSWRRIASPVEALLATGVQLRNNDIVLAGHARTVIVSRDSGETLAASASGLASAVAELLELPDGNLLALGEAGATVLPAP